MTTLLSKDELEAVIVDVLQESLGIDDPVEVAPEKSLGELGAEEFIDMLDIAFRIERALNITLNDRDMHNILVDGSLIPRADERGIHRPFHGFFRVPLDRAIDPKTMQASIERWQSGPLTVGRLQQAVASAYATVFLEKVEPDAVGEKVEA